MLVSGRGLEDEKRMLTVIYILRKGVSLPEYSFDYVAKTILET